MDGELRVLRDPQTGPPVGIPGTPAWSTVSAAIEKADSPGTSYDPGDQRADDPLRRRRIDSIAADIGHWRS